MEYRVELDVYNGPLDLLLYLLKRDELDIYDIPIARITDSYMQYVNMLRELSKEDGLDINVAGEFLVMAATLMEIKSAMLLPKQPPVERRRRRTTAAQELADPRYELVQKLLEYKRFKDSAAMLERQQHEHENRFPRYPGEARRRRRRAAAGGSGRGAGLGPARGVQPADEGGRRRGSGSTRSRTTTRRSTCTPPTSRTG